MKNAAKYTAKRIEGGYIYRNQEIEKIEGGLSFQKFWHRGMYYRTLTAAKEAVDFLIERAAAKRAAAEVTEEVVTEPVVKSTEELTKDQAIAEGMTEKAASRLAAQVWVKGLTEVIVGGGIYSPKADGKINVLITVKSAAGLIQQDIIVNSSTGNIIRKNKPVRL